MLDQRRDSREISIAASLSRYCAISATGRFKKSVPIRWAVAPIEAIKPGRSLSLFGSSSIKI
jgi:hypothetical protein